MWSMAPRNNLFELGLGFLQTPAASQRQDPARQRRAHPGLGRVFRRQLGVQLRLDVPRARVLHAADLLHQQGRRVRDADRRGRRARHPVLQQHQQDDDDAVVVRGSIMPTVAIGDTMQFNGFPVEIAVQMSLSLLEPAGPLGSRMGFSVAARYVFGRTKTRDVVRFKICRSVADRTREHRLRREVARAARRDRARPRGYRAGRHRDRVDQTTRIRRSPLARRVAVGDRANRLRDHRALARHRYEQSDETDVAAPRKAGDHLLANALHEGLATLPDDQQLIDRAAPSRGLHDAGVRRRAGRVDRRREVSARDRAPRAQGVARVAIHHQHRESHERRRRSARSAPRRRVQRGSPRPGGARYRRCPRADLAPASDRIARARPVPAQRSPWFRRGFALAAAVLFGATLGFAAGRISRPATPTTPAYVPEASITRSDAAPPADASIVAAPPIDAAPIDAPIAQIEHRPDTGPLAEPLL